MRVIIPMEEIILDVEMRVLSLIVLEVVEMNVQFVIFHSRAFAITPITINFSICTSNYCFQSIKTIPPFLLLQLVFHPNMDPCPNMAL